MGASTIELSLFSSITIRVRYHSSQTLWNDVCLRHLFRTEQRCYICPPERVQQSVVIPMIWLYITCPRLHILFIYSAACEQAALFEDCLQIWRDVWVGAQGVVLSASFGVLFVLMLICSFNSWRSQHFLACLIQCVVFCLLTQTLTLPNFLACLIICTRRTQYTTSFQSPSESRNNF